MNHSCDYFTLAVKSSEDVIAEPVRGQKIEEHVGTDLDQRNDENRSSSDMSNPNGSLSQKCLSLS